jgi:lipoprotein-releasing system ATP-binding protein
LIYILNKESVSIVGASAGKTTLLQILGTLDKPSTDKGIELKINGDDILSMKDKTLSKFRNLNLGFIFSFTNYYLSLRL